MKYLFIGGPQRSGTTAFVSLINRHPKVALGVERYKNVYGKISEVTPQLFEPERFFASPEGGDGINWGRYGDIDLFKKKFERAAYRGDKVPHIMRYQARISEAMPNSKFIIMYRNIERVCASWNRRALDEKDAWNTENDFRKAVEVINDELRRTLKFSRTNPDRCMVVRYENIFGESGKETMGSILSWLDLPVDERVLKALHLNEVRVVPNIKSKPLLELEGQRDFVLSNIDWAVIREIDSLAV